MENGVFSKAKLTALTILLGAGTNQEKAEVIFQH
jgi:hypothetical protein